MTKNICKNPKCKKEIPPERLKYNAKYCSARCRHLMDNKKWGYCSRKIKLSSNTRGTIAELIVCAHLLKRGFEIFRAVSPACSCDLILLHKGKPFRVEVRSLYQYYKNKIPSLPQKDKDKSDFVAWVFHGDKIVYDPPLNVLKSTQRQC